VTDVVRYERSAVQNHRRLGGGKPLRQIIGSDDADLAQHQLAMEAVVLRAGTVRQAGGLQFAALRGRRQMLMMMKMMVMMMVVIVMVVEVTTIDVVVVVVAVRLLDHDRGWFGGITVVVNDRGGDRRDAR